MIDSGAGWTMHLGDCLEVMRGIDRVDAVVTDPPYGIGEAAGKNRSRSKLAVAKDYGDSDWDDVPASKDSIDSTRAISDFQIIFGGNYFELPPSKCWLVWDKVNGENDFADCELAWTNLNRAVRRIAWQWNGMLRRGREPREHPTQKPIGVMLWAIGLLPETCETILDPFAGSGSTGVAAIRLGRKFVGIEKDPKYFALACERLRAEEQGISLHASRAGQVSMFAGVK